MTTTAKEYIFKAELQSELRREAYNAKIQENWQYKFELEKMADQMDADYFNHLPTVNVSFSIGSRKYYENVVKIGTRYYKNGKSMTKGRGYYNIKEIFEITERMTKDMIDDMYYY